LGARKGAPDLLQALAGLRSDLGWSITMAGDGDIAGSRKRAQELGLLDRVTFTGWLDAEQVDDLLESSDVLVLPSYAEGLPMSVIEAFAHGVAVIATPVGAIPEIVIDGESGLLVPAGDTGALCDVIQTLCVDADMRQKLARAGRKMWEKDLDITEYAVRLSTIWRTVAAHPAVSASAAG
jgi:glycosyltransferase involved in cell wall biosynthesis